MSSKLQIPRISDAIASTLEQRILEGSLRPGDRLPPERELAAELGVEPYVLREFDITITDPMTEAEAAAIREAWASYEVQE